MLNASGDRGKLSLAAVLILAGYALPLYAGNYLLFFVATTYLLAAFAITWDFFSGISHYLSFGHMFLIGLAGYTSALVNSELGLPLFVSIIAAVLVTGLLGTLILAGPSLRLSGIHFVTLTLVLPLIAEKLVIIFSDITGGAAGYTFINSLSTSLPDSFLGLSTAHLQYYIILSVFVLTTILLVVMKNSELGIILRAISQDELLLATQGVDPTRFKLVGFGITALLTGLSAAIWTHFQVALSPASHLTIGVQVDIIVASIIGGIGTVVGPILGMFVLRILEEVLRKVEGLVFLTDTLDIELVEFRRLITMLVALGFFYFYPNGIYPRLERAIGWVINALTRGNEDTALAEGSEE